MIVYATQHVRQPDLDDPAAIAGSASRILQIMARWRYSGPGNA